MKKKILAFGASSSRQSINKNLAAFAAGTVENGEVTILDLNDFEMPIYNIDREKEDGIRLIFSPFLQGLSGNNFFYLKKYFP